MSDAAKKHAEGLMRKNQGRFFREEQGKTKKPSEMA